MTTATVPATLDEVTPEWLTHALREGGLLGDAAVTGMQRQIIGEGSGFVGLLARLTLEYDRSIEGAPRTLIVKLPSSMPMARALANFFRFYEREIRFYREVAQQSTLRTPRCYASAMDPAAGNFILLLEDLSAFRLGDQLASCSIDDARLAIEELARFHADWWESPRLEALDWMLLPSDPLNRLAGPQLVQTLPVLIERYGEYV
ncbi:MAG: protein kinase family protein, partial [Dehalococcoidia bacterium]